MGRLGWVEGEGFPALKRDGGQDLGTPRGDRARPGGGPRLRDDAAQRRVARPAAVRRRVCLHARRLAAGDAAHRPGRPRPGQAAGGALPRPRASTATFWTITDDHLPDAARGAGLRRLHRRPPRLGRERRGWASSATINARLRETPLLELGEGRWNVDEMAFYDVPAVLDYVKARDRPRPGQLGRPQPGGDADLPLPRAVARGVPDRQLRGDGEHDHPGRGAREGHAPRQPRAAAAGAVREHGAARPAA